MAFSVSFLLSVKGLADQPSVSSSKFDPPAIPKQVLETIPLVSSIAMNGSCKYQPGQHFNLVNPQAPKGGTLKLPSVTPPFTTVNPFCPEQQCAPMVALLTFDSLMVHSPDEPFSIYAKLAKYIQLPPDRSWMVIHLDPMARFSTGEPVTAHDVKHTFNLLSQHGSVTRRALAAKIKEFAIVDDHTIHLVFRPDDKGLYDRELPLVFLIMPVLSAAHTPSKTFCKSGMTPLVGSGPYIISNIDPGRKIVYQKNPSYWAKDLPICQGLFNVDSVSVDIFYSELTAFEAFKRGLVDVWVEEDLGRWRNGYDCPAVREGLIRRQEIAHGQPAGIYGFVFNQDRPSLKDQRVRQAITLAFDYGMLLAQFSPKDYARTESFYQNSPFQASENVSQAEKNIINALPIPLTQTTLPPIHEHSFSKALELFAQAGWHPHNNLLMKKGAPLTLTILIKSKELEQGRLAEALATCLRRVGVTVHIHRRENTQFMSDLRARNFDIALWKWVTSLSPGIEQTLYWHSRSAAQPSTRNYGNIRNPNVDFLCDKILESTSVEDLTATTKVLDRVLRQGYYVLPLFHKTKDYRAFWKQVKVPPFPAHSPYWPPTESFWIEP